MDEIWAELALIFILIVCNGFFAAAEIALVSARRAPILALARKGDRRARRVSELQADPERFLATVQVGISLSTILAGVLGGAVFVQALEAVLVRIPWGFVRSTAAGLAFAVVSIIITYLSIVLGEILPKSVALRRPERWALRLVRPVYLLSRAAHPIVVFLAASGRVLARLLGARGTRRGAMISEEEVRWLVREGRRQGIFDQTEQELIAQVFSFADTQARRAMTARIDISAIDRSWPQDRILKFITVEGYSRYPVFEESLDRITGIVHTKDVINVLTAGGAIILEDLIRPPMFVADSQLLGPLLRRMQSHQEHMAIVLDEFGGTAGLITLEDLLEEIVGEIRDEHDIEVQEIVLDSKGRARIAGKTPIDEFNEYFQCQLDESVADTVAGYVVHTLGHIPDVGETVEAGNVRLRVARVRENRVDWLEGERLKPPAGSKASG